MVAQAASAQVVPLHAGGGAATQEDTRAFGEGAVPAKVGCGKEGDTRTNWAVFNCICNYAAANLLALVTDPATRNVSSTTCWQSPTAKRDPRAEPPWPSGWPFSGPFGTGAARRVRTQFSGEKPPRSAQCSFTLIQEGASPSRQRGTGMASARMMASRPRHVRHVRSGAAQGFTRAQGLRKICLRRDPR